MVKLDEIVITFTVAFEAAINDIHVTSLCQDCQLGKKLKLSKRAPLAHHDWYLRPQDYYQY
jgi:hypothetical protein